MPKITRPLFAIGGALLLSATLISCGAAVSQPNSEDRETPPPVSVPIRTLPSTQPIQEDATHTEESTSEPEAGASPTTTAISQDQQNSTAPSVEASTMEPNQKNEEFPAESVFEPESPTLGGIRLGTLEKEVFEHFGLPIETYPLPGGTQTIEICEYNGLSIGLSSKGRVVYVEITSAAVNTGIRGLTNGMDGSKAAQLLGLSDNEQTHVLTLDVTGGLFRLDLDPDTQQVLSLKLMSKDI